MAGQNAAKPPETLSMDEALADETPQNTVPKQSMMQTIGQGAKDFGKGLLESGVNTLHGIGSAEHALMPQGLRSTGYGKNFEAGLDTMADAAKPEGWMQNIGKGLGDVGQFFIPGGVEEEAAAHLPMLGRFAKPLMRMAGGEAVNEAEGGPTGAGAAGTGVGEGMAAVMKRLAPYVAETAMRIPALQKGFGKTPGAAILEDTRGVLPSTIGRTGQETASNLTGQVERMADQASFKNRPRISGLLTAPPEEIPLAQKSGRNPRMSPMAFDADVNPEEPLEPRSGDPMAPISEYPGINPHYLSGSEHPELSGRVAQPQGVLLRPAPVGSGPIPTIEPNNIASLRPARQVLSQASARASQENAPSRFAQIEPMRSQLMQRFSTGEPIPENVTPRDLLDLKRGFSDEHLGRWNPDLHGKTVATGRSAYHALDQEFDKAVPGAADMNQRISSLIPVIHAADKAERAPSLFQRTAGRIGAHTGALTGAVGGALEGQRLGGTPGALVGGAAGLLLPELLMSPESQMMAARTMASTGVQNAAPHAMAAGVSKGTSALMDFLRRNKGEE